MKEKTKTITIYQDAGPSKTTSAIGIKDAREKIDLSSVPLLSKETGKISRSPQ